MIDGLSEAQIRLQMVPGKWSVFENIVHLQTYQHVFTGRIRQILEGNNPEFERYTADADPLYLDNCHLTFREIMQDFIALRKEMAAGVLSFPETDHVKTGMHPLYGKLTLLQWLNFFLLHEAHHLFTIFKQTAELRGVN